MIRIKYWRLVLLLLAFLAAIPAQAESPEISERHHQILVLLKLAPEHYRPGSQYGGGYGDNLARSARLRTARRIARAHNLTLVDAWPMPLLGLDCVIMDVADGKSVEEVAAQVSQDPGVRWAQPMHDFHPLADRSRYNDPLFAAQPVSRAWSLEELHRISTGRGVTVAVIDSEIETSHPDLIGQLATNRNFAAEQAAASEQHGTAVAGIIAAKANNRLGIVGIAPNAKLLGLRACWQAGKETTCNSLSLAKALHFAIERNAQIINLSLGGPPDLLLGKLIDVGLSRGITIVAAFDRTRPRGGFPASQPGVIAVADESLAAPMPGVYSAPGRDVLTTQPGGGWYLVNGSSYAAAHVSGLAALLRQKRVSPVKPIHFVSAWAGGGAINACATLLRAMPCDCDCVSMSKVASNAQR